MVCYTVFTKEDATLSAKEVLPMVSDNRRAAVRITALALVLTLLFTSNAFAATRYSTLEFGSRGSDVLKLQKALLTLGYDPSGTDGKFGRGTESAVILYQTGKGLTADGKAGTQTLSALYADAESAAAATTQTDTSATSTTVATTNPNTLQYGDSGDRVTTLQTALVKLGYDTNGVDGRYGAGTRKAVVAFQKANGLTTDGLAGTKTQQMLYSQAESTATTTADTTTTTDTTDTTANTTNGGFTRTLRKGYTGSDVTAVQTQLQTLGYYASTLDGVYGAGTMAAVSAFQKNNGLSVDGLVGAKTYEKLFSASAVTSSSTTTGNTTDTSTDTTTASTYVSLALGATGTAVKTLQKALQNLGYNVTADGNFGALTKSAVTAFQRLNGLTADGTAGALTQEKLYSGSAVAYDSSADTSVILDDDTGKATGPSTSAVQCLYWITEVKPTIKSGQYITVFDPATNLQWTLRLYSLGRHADSEPLTATDTAIMYKAFGYTNTWTPKPVYVKLPSGTWTLATTHNVAHLSGSISNNNFDGHLCVHFLRTLEECAANDPDYGMTNQLAIRKKWKEMTGIEIAD